MECKTSEATKRVLEIARTIDELASKMKPERNSLNLQSITFAPEHEDDGCAAIFLAGTVVATGESGLVRVPERTLKILATLQIPFLVVE